MDKNVISVKGRECLQLVAATDGDIVLLRTWFKTTRDLVFWGGPSMQDSKTEESFANALSKNNFTSYSLRANKRLLGFSQIQKHPNNRAHIGRLVISPNLRGQGLSHILLEHLFAIAHKQFKASAVSLFVYRSNTHAQHTYMKNGFVSTPIPKGMPNMQGCDYMLKRL